MIPFHSKSSLSNQSCIPLSPGIVLNMICLASKQYWQYSTALFPVLFNSRFLQNSLTLDTHMLRRHGTHRLDSVSNAHDQLAIFLHLVDKLHGQHAAVKCLAELLGSCIQSTSKTVPLEFMNKSCFSTETT